MFTFSLLDVQPADDQSVQEEAAGLSHHRHQEEEAEGGESEEEERLHSAQSERQETPEINQPERDCHQT